MIVDCTAKCVADAGYFANIASAFGQPPVHNLRDSIIEYEYTWVFTNQQANNSRIGVNQNCLAALGRSNPLCFFPEYSLQYMKTPMFVLQSGYVSAHASIHRVFAIFFISVPLACAVVCLCSLTADLRTLMHFDGFLHRIRGRPISSGSLQTVASPQTQAGTAARSTSTNVTRANLSRWKRTTRSSSASSHRC